MITVEEILEYLNSDRIEDMTEEMHECSGRQSQSSKIKDVCDENKNDFSGFIFET